MARLGMYSLPMSPITSSMKSLSRSSELLPLPSSSSDSQSRIRLDPSTKSKISWSCQQIFPSEPGSQSHGSTSESKNLIHSSGNQSLKIANFREYLEVGLSGSMKNCNLTNSILSVSGPSTLSIFFSLETKGKGVGVFSSKEGGKATEDMESLLMAIVQIDFAPQ
jgi:hypothetical protein